MTPPEAEVRALVRDILTRLEKQSGSGDAVRSPTAPAVAAGVPGRSGRRLVTADDLTALAPGSSLDLAANAIITPLAQDLARERGIDLRTTPAAPAQPTGPAQRAVAIGADHGGYALKEQLKPYLLELGYEPVDVGAHSKESVDYPDFAFSVASLVAQGRCGAGIVIDGAGIGSCMAANKVPGVRASLCYDVSSAGNAREHNHANVLTLGAGLVGAGLARQIVKTWLETPWGGDRHARRVEKITAIEKRFSR